MARIKFEKDILVDLINDVTLPTLNKKLEESNPYRTEYRVNWFGRTKQVTIYNEEKEFDQRFCRERIRRVEDLLRRVQSAYCREIWLDTEDMNLIGL